MSAYLATRYSLLATHYSHREEHKPRQQKYRDQHGARPQHVAEEARHPDAALAGDRIDHEVRRVADIGVGAHEAGAERDRGERLGEPRHQGIRVAAGELEENEV